MDLQNTAASIPAKHEPVGNPQIILTSVRLMTTCVPRWVRQNSIHFFVLQHKSTIKLNLNEIFQFVKWIPHQRSCDTRVETIPSEVENLVIGYLNIWAFGQICCQSQTAILDKQDNSHSHMVGSSTGPKRPIKILGPYKDDIGRSQTYLMLFYRLKCYLARKDYCHSTSRN